MIKKNLYAIYDDVSEDVIGGLMLETHDAPVIRMFHDAAHQEGSKIQLHLADLKLVRLGTINEELTITPDVEIVITGKKILADLANLNRK